MFHDLSVNFVIPLHSTLGYRGFGYSAFMLSRTLEKLQNSAIACPDACYSASGGHGYDRGHRNLLSRLSIYLSFKNTVNLFIHIARISIGDSPRVHPNILKCLLHSPVAKGYRLVVIASRAMVCKTPTYYLILYPLAYTRGCVILRSHILILLLLILLIFHHIHS